MWIDAGFIGALVTAEKCFAENDYGIDGLLGDKEAESRSLFVTLSSLNCYTDFNENCHGNTFFWHWNFYSKATLCGDNRHKRG